MNEHATRQQLLEWDRRHYWHAFTQMAEYEPLVIARADGCRLYDIDGRAYLDGASSMWCNVHGHRHPRVDAAVRDQLDRVAHCTSLGMGCDTSVRLARRLAELAPGNLEHVFFSSDGSSAMEVALKMAFQYWRQCENPQPKKTKFIAFGEAYHGDTIGAASVGGIPRFHAIFQPLLFDVIRASTPDPRRVPQGVSSAEAWWYYADEIRYLTSVHRDEVAAIVIEPLVQCAAGMVMHPPGFLRHVKQLAEYRGILLIADEIAVGFGRTGKMFACEHESVVPDILCLGKGLSGGYLPLAATLTNDAIYNAFLGEHQSGRTLHHGHTFAGNPLACAAALASLDVFEEERTLAKLVAKIERLGDHLVRLAEHPHVANTRQCGLIGAVELTPDKAFGLPYPADERRAWRVCHEALSRGVWLRPLADVLYIMPPLAITIEDIDFLIETLAAAIDSITN